jgi:hypothetical protein
VTVNFVDSHRQLPVCLFIVKITAFGSLKSITNTGRIFNMSNCVHRSKLTLLACFFSTPIVKTISACTKTESTKKNLSHDTNPQCCRSGMFIPDLGPNCSVPDPPSRVKNIPDLDLDQIKEFVTQKSSIADLDPGYSAFLNPGSGMGKK